MVDREDVKVNPRILVVLEPHAESARLFRAAKRRAELERLDWEVLVIDAPRLYRKLTQEEKENVINLVALADQMGAIITRRSAPSLAQGVAAIYNERIQQGVPIYSIKLGDIRARKSWFYPGEPLIEKIKSLVGDAVKVVTVPLGLEDRATLRITDILHVNPRDIAISLLGVILATLTIRIIQYVEPDLFGADHNRNKAIIYLLACVFASGRYGFLCGLISATVSFFILCIFHVAPYYSLWIDNPADGMDLGLFMLAGIAISLQGNHNYGSRLRLSKRADRFHSLLTVHRLALSKNSVEEAIATLDAEIKRLLDAEVAFFMPKATDEAVLEAPFDHNVELNDADRKALTLSWMESKTSGVGAAFEPEGCNWRFEPLVTARDEIGVLGVRINDTMELDANFIRLLSGIADQIALILERLQLGHMAEEVKIQAEREKLRSMLLSSVSHDLKTPLASVIGSLSVYRSMGENLPQEHRATLINTALEEAQRLDSFITNILDMTRIESGQIEMKQEWSKPAELVDEVKKRLRERLREYPLTIKEDNSDFEVNLDAIMTGQVIQNVLDNATKYTPPGTHIDIGWVIDADKFVLTIRDHGPGIPEDKLEKIFDKYSRIKRRDSQVAGTGLGLSIARAVMRMQGGSITAANHPDGGAMFTLILPKTRKMVSCR